MSDEVIVAADALRALIHEIVRHGGSEAAECKIVSDHLVGANLAGHDSHGVGIVPTYVINLQNKLLIPNTEVATVRDDGAFLQFDGGKGYGQRVAAEAMQAAIDYGQAIRDLALSNVFPGDLLLKNFGVSRHGRVIFYDYDELCFVTDCNFRRIPEARDELDEMRASAWFYIGPHDVFPEQFIQFLSFKEDIREAFLEHHADLLTARFWSRLKVRHESGEILEVLPYTAKQWTEHRGHALYPASG